MPIVETFVDACCLINLFASGSIEQIIPACGRDFYVSPHVRGESLTIRQPDPLDASLLVPTPIDLTKAITEGLVKECQFQGPAELDSFLEFAMQVDDGEASCLAIAKARGWAIATDDQKASRIAQAVNIPIISTPELMQLWVSVANPTSQDISRTLGFIERFAKFRPRRNSTFYSWWSSYCP